MKFIDSHTHLFAEQFDVDRDETIQRAIDAGVYRMYLPNIDLSTVEAMMSLSQKWPENCFPMIGLHPGSVTADYKEQLSGLKKWLDKEPYYAIGEIGLDFYWDVTYKEEQINAFETQIQWALEVDLPIVIHTRKSIPEGIEVVSKYQNGNLRGVFHCFAGTVEEAKQIEDLGFLIGVGGIATFKNGHLEPIIKAVDLKNIMLETDSPYLAPSPNRGKRNESAYIPLIAQKVADVKEVSLEKVAEVTTQNALHFYRKTQTK